MPLPRLALTPEVGHGPLDGAWWPRCDSLELELPSLVAALEPDRGSTVRITVDAAQWPDPPHTIMAPGQVIAVDVTGSADGEISVGSKGELGTRHREYSPNRPIEQNYSRHIVEHHVLLSNQVAVVVAKRFIFRRADHHGDTERAQGELRAPFPKEN
ncbi:DUF5994 family protein [Streptomyces sp. TLI_55]|uniref:DUF5994 family protein n=1 Tax=Streptomyces sp. TLI_55 TaxID=1938861 RepID=UPI00117C70BB|nr:DUF5994 family protein [Streptomyces sp. TLI_55]